MSASQPPGPAPSPSSPPGPPALSTPQPPPRGAAALSDPGLALPAGQGHALRGEYGMQGGGAGPLLLVGLQWPRLFCPDASARVCPPSVRDPGSFLQSLSPLCPWGDGAPSVRCLLCSPHSNEGLLKTCPLRRGVRSVQDRLTALSPGSRPPRLSRSHVERGRQRAVAGDQSPPDGLPPSACLALHPP